MELAWAFSTYLSVVCIQKKTISIYTSGRQVKLYTSGIHTLIYPLFAPGVPAGRPLPGPGPQCTQGTEISTPGTEGYSPLYRV